VIPVRTVASADPTTPPEAPSWGRVLATTLGLWASRRLLGPRGLRRPWRVLLLVICALVVAGTAVGVVRLTGTSSRSARVSSSARPDQGRPGGSARPAGPAGVAASVRSQAAAWIAGQVSSDDTIGCDPLMCAALSAHGVPAGRLLALGAAASSAPGAEVIAISPAPRTGFSQAAPALLASFGSGGSLIEVRATSPGGAATYQAALAADVAARRSAGAQLLHSRRLEVGVQGAGQLQADQLQAGQVDSRLLVMLALLASQRSWRVIAFGDASPGVPFAEAPFRQVIITGTGGAGGRGGAEGLAAALALVRAQRGLYQPAQVTMVRLADGQPGLRIDFAAPSPLGLLTGGAPR
jgi:hypothetical protein